MKKNRVRRLTVIAILSSVATALMYLEIPVPFLVYKIDLSDVPALIGAFAYGPIAGIIIELVKNLAHLPVGIVSGFLGIGEFANFLIGVSFVVPASIIYSVNKTKRNALFSMGISIIIVLVASVILNAFVFLPLYSRLVFGISVSELIGYYTADFPMIKDIYSFLLFGTVPFNLVKFLLVSVIVMLIYKRISHLIKAKDGNYTC